MSATFASAVAVIGPPWSGAKYAAKYLERQGFQVERVEPYPDEIDDFVKRGGLVVWIERPTRERFIALRKAGQRPGNWTKFEGEERYRRRAAAGMRTLLDDEETNPFYGWYLAQIIIHYRCGRNTLELLLAQLAAEVTYPEHLFFMERDEQLAFRIPERVGFNGCQLYEMGAEKPKPVFA